MNNFKPMLAAKADLDKVQFPIIGQPKYDGIRCCLDFGGRALSRTLKDIPNRHIQERMRRLDGLMNGSSFGLDGEIVTYTRGTMDSLYTVQSKVMSVEGEFEFKYHVFDEYTSKDLPYEKRHEMLRKLLTPVMGDVIDYVSLVRNKMLLDMDDLNLYEEELVRQGWEGMIGRKPSGFYKYGRATVNEGLLLKFKRFEDAEAVIIGYEELEHNENEAFRDERGQQKRSSHKENKVPGQTLGALLLKWGDIEFKVGTGFDEEQRREIWTNSEEFMGRTVTFKYKGTGPNGKPLIASFKSFRDDVAAEPVVKRPTEIQGSFF